MRVVSNASMPFLVRLMPITQVMVDVLLGVGQSILDEVTARLMPVGIISNLV